MHYLIVTLLFIITVALYPGWGWPHELGSGPFFGALAMLVVVIVLHWFKVL